MEKWFQYRLARDIRFVHKMWSVRLMVIGALVEGAWAGWPAFQNAVPPGHFMGVCIGLSMAALFARITGQKNIPQEGPHG